MHPRFYPGGVVLGPESLGERLGKLRRRRGLTQEQLATASGVSVAAIRKIERDAQSTARLATLHRLATVLGVPTTALLAAPKAKPAKATDDPGLLTIRRALQPIRSVNGLTFAEDATTAPTLTALRESLRAANRVYQGDDYDLVLRLAPGLLAEARILVRETEGDDRLAAQALLAQVYQLAGGVLTQLRHTDLAAFALDEAIRLADTAGDRLTAASAVVSQCWVLRRQARLDEAEQLAIATADAIEPSFRTATRSQLATWGWLALRASAAAARNNRPDEADDLIRTATAAATRIGADFIDYHEYWSSFGPVTVAYKHVENKVVEHDPHAALALADRIPPDPSARPTSNNRNRHLLDLAWAHVQLRHYSEATAILLAINRAAPEWLRYQRFAHETATRIVAHRARSLPPELVALADALDIEV